MDNYPTKIQYKLLVVVYYHSVQYSIEMNRWPPFKLLQVAWFIALEFFAYYLNYDSMPSKEIDDWGVCKEFNRLTRFFHSWSTLDGL